MNTTEIPATYARLTRQQAQAMIAMTEDALTSPAADVDALKRHLGHLQAVVGLAPSQPQCDEVTVGRRAGSATSNQYGTFAVHSASDKQVRFVQQLIDTRDHGSVKVPTTVEGISKKAASALIDQLIDRPFKSATASRPAATTGRPATDKQLAFLATLAGDRDWAGVVAGLDIDTSRPMPELTSTQASEVIETLKSAPRKQRQATPAASELEIGVYRTGDGSIYRVYPAQSGNRLFAGLLTLPEGWADMTQDERIGCYFQPSWDYKGMAYRFVTAEQKLTLEEAQQFGAIVGVCCCCGKTLTKQSSIEAGIGPVCAKKFA